MFAFQNGVKHVKFFLVFEQGRYQNIDREIELDSKTSSYSDIININITRNKLLVENRDKKCAQEIDAFTHVL